MEVGICLPYMKQGLTREQTGLGLRRVLMQRFRGKALETALAHWLKHPGGAGRPDHPGKAGRGRDPRKGDKPRKGGKGGKPPKKGSKKGMAAPGRR